MSFRSSPSSLIIEEVIMGFPQTGRASTSATVIEDVIMGRSAASVVIEDHLVQRSPEQSCLSLDAGLVVIEDHVVEKASLDTFSDIFG